jgi:hypothetical protein
VPGRDRGQLVPVRPHRVLGAVDQVLVPSAVMRDVVVANGLAPERVDVDANDVDVEAARPGRVDHADGSAGDVRFG